MARRSGFLRAMVQAQREVERKRAFELREMDKAQTQTAKAAEKAQKEYQDAMKKMQTQTVKEQKEYEKERIANQKEQARLYVESRVAQVQLQNEQLEQQIKSTPSRILCNRTLPSRFSIPFTQNTRWYPYLVRCPFRRSIYRYSDTQTNL